MTATAIEGCLVGQAIGDMMGLPYENLSARRITKLASFEHPRFFFGYGSGSDDTEHLGLTAEAAQYAQGDVDVFRKRLASGLRRWFLAGPPGIGFATLKACLKLCLGVSSKVSGVKSAGNGPAMRASILGLMVDAANLTAFVDASTRLTHTDIRAIHGSRILAQLASVAPTIDPRSGHLWLQQQIEQLPSDPKLEPLTQFLRSASVALNSKQSVAEFAATIGCKKGVSGFIAHTIPVAVFAFFRHADDYRCGIETVIRCGGDTDTVAAIVGGLIGSRVGREGILVQWQTRHRDWPWSLQNLVNFRRPSLLQIPLVFLRNLAFFVIVVGHIIRRCLPPW